MTKQEIDRHSRYQARTTLVDVVHAMDKDAMVDDDWKNIEDAIERLRVVYKATIAVREADA